MSKYNYKLELKQRAGLNLQSLYKNVKVCRNCYTIYSMLFKSFEAEDTVDMTKQDKSRMVKSMSTTNYAKLTRDTIDQNITDKRRVLGFYIRSIKNIAGAKSRGTKEEEDRYPATDKPIARSVSVEDDPSHKVISYDLYEGTFLNMKGDQVPIHPEEKQKAPEENDRTGKHMDHVSISSGLEKSYVFPHSARLISLER
jgi:hypothetical protein